MSGNEDSDDKAKSPLLRLFKNGEVSEAFRRYAEVNGQDIDRMGYVELYRCWKDWLEQTSNRDRDLRLLFGPTSYSAEFRRYFAMSGRDPKKTTRAELWKLWLDWNDIEREVAEAEKRMRWASGRYGSRTRGLIEAGLKGKAGRYEDLMHQGGVKRVEEPVDAYGELMRKGLRAKGVSDETAGE